MSPGPDSPPGLHPSIPLDPPGTSWPQHCSRELGRGLEMQAPTRGARWAKPHHPALLDPRVWMKTPPMALFQHQGPPEQRAVSFSLLGWARCALPRPEVRPVAVLMSHRATPHPQGWRGGRLGGPKPGLRASRGRLPSHKGGTAHLAARPPVTAPSVVALEGSGVGLSAAFAACPCAQAQEQGPQHPQQSRAGKNPPPALCVLGCDRIREWLLGHRADGTPNESRRGVQAEQCPPRPPQASQQATRQQAYRGGPPAPSALHQPSMTLMGDKAN